MKMFVVWQKASPILGMPLLNILYIFYFSVGAPRCFPSSILKVECHMFFICDMGFLAVSRWVGEAKQVENSVEPVFAAVMHTGDLLLWG